MLRACPLGGLWVQGGVKGRHCISWWAVTFLQPPDIQKPSSPPVGMGLLCLARQGCLSLWVSWGDGSPLGTLAIVAAPGIRSSWKGRPRSDLGPSSFVVWIQKLKPEGRDSCKTAQRVSHRPKAWSKPWGFLSVIDVCFTFPFPIRNPWVSCLLSSESSGFGKSRGCVCWLNSSGFNCCCSVAQSCLTLCDLVDCSAPGFPVLHHLPELAQTHVHRVSDAIQPSHPLFPPSPPACNLSQHQGLFQ